MLHIPRKKLILSNPQRMILCAMLCMTAIACDSRQLSTPKSARADQIAISPSFIPWVEINNPKMKLSKVNPDLDRRQGEDTLRDHNLRGLKLWGQVCDKVIVTTRPGKVESLYPDLMKNKPRHLQIIGGLKTYILPGASSSDKRRYDFAHAHTWKDIVDQARRIVQITGTNIVVLENETALKPFHQGKSKIDFDQLRLAMAPLKESGIQFWWWWPAVLNNTSKFSNRQLQTAQLTSVISKAVPNSIFIGAYHAWHHGLSDKSNLKRRQSMVDITTESRLHEILYVQPDGFVHYSLIKKKQCYKPGDISSLSEQHPDETYILYPGVANWVMMAELFVP